MIYALDDSGVKIEAAKGRQGRCPLCRERLIARCGPIRVWHWGHRGRLECDPWQECESEWHRAWKLRAPADRVEVCYGEHRADILAADDCVIELQHSPLGLEEIWDRERFYGRMIWLLDGATFRDRIRVETRGDHVEFSWAHGRETWSRAGRPIFIHAFTLGTHLRAPNPATGKMERRWRPLAPSSDILQILEFRRRPRLHGTGRILSLDRFCERMLPDGRKNEIDPRKTARPVV